MVFSSLVSLSIPRILTTRLQNLGCTATAQNISEPLSNSVTACSHICIPLWNVLMKPDFLLWSLCAVLSKMTRSAMKKALTSCLVTPLLVANVVEKGATTRKIYLPEGNKFYDFYTRTPYDGGQTIEIPVDLGSILCL